MSAIVAVRFGRRPLREICVGRPIASGLATSLYVLSAASSAMAQPAPADQGSASTGLKEPSRNITASRQTKPPGEALGPCEGTSPGLEQEHREIDQHTLESICTGAPGCQ